MVSKQGFQKWVASKMVSEKTLELTPTMWETLKHNRRLTAGLRERNLSGKLKFAARFLSILRSNFKENKVAAKKGQSPSMTCVACSDARVSPFSISLPYNNSFNIEVAGSVLLMNETSEAPTSINYAINHISSLDTILILSHNGCGLINTFLKHKYAGDEAAIKDNKVFSFVDKVYSENLNSFTRTPLVLTGDKDGYFKPLPQDLALALLTVSEVANSVKKALQEAGKEHIKVYSAHLDMATQLIYPFEIYKALPTVKKYVIFYDERGKATVLNFNDNGALQV